MSFSPSQILSAVFNSAAPKHLKVASVGGFSPPALTDAITITYPTDTTEVFAYRSGGAAGSVLMTMTLTYTDSTKAVLSTVVKS